MVHYISDKQLTIFEFETPFNVQLLEDNRWVKMSKDVPWDIFANYYLLCMLLMDAQEYPQEQS